MTTTFDASHARYLREHQLGLLATVAPNGAPQNKPVGYRFDGTRGTIEIGGIEMERSSKFRNIALRPQVAFTVEDRPDPSAGAAAVRFVEVRGQATQVELDGPPMEGTTRWIIRIHPRRVVSWNVAGSGLFSADLGGGGDGEARPAAGLDGSVSERAYAAVARLAGELQTGLQRGEAEVFNRHFARDVMWGSTYGATVDGYDDLHAIHERLQSADEHRRSWLAAGQNTIVVEDRGALGTGSR